MTFYHTKTCRERHAIPSTFAISLYLLTLFQIFFMVHPRFCREIPIQFDGISHLFPKMAWGKTTHQRTNKKKKKQRRSRQSSAQMKAQSTWQRGLRLFRHLPYSALGDANEMGLLGVSVCFFVWRSC